MKVSSTPFSDFIRNASPDEKTRVYGEVLREATETQRNYFYKAANDARLRVVRHWRGKRMVFWRRRAQVCIATAAWSKG